MTKPSTLPSLQKLSEEQKKIIKDRISNSFPDDVIINEFSSNFEISPEILRKIRSEIEVTAKLAPLKEKYLEPLAEACLKKFSEKKDDPENFKKQLMDISYTPPAQKPTAESIDKIIADGKKEDYLNLLRPLEAKDLMNLDTNRKLQVIDQKDLENIEPKLKSYFKITFDEQGAPTITPLDRDKIWEEGGLDKNGPFVLINPGNGGANKREQLTLSEHFDKSLLYEAKLFEKGHKGTPPTQYLVALNETAGGVNFDLISAHNQDPNNFKTVYTTEQAKTIYGPLIIQKDGKALDDEKIIENLAKARNFNCSFGTVTANCQQNALVDYMKELGIKDSTIKAGIEGMRRLDLANVAKVSDNENPRPSTVIFQGENDQLAPIQEKAQLPAGHSNVSLVRAEENVAIVYQTFPNEVYAPGKNLTEEQKKQEEAIRSGTKSYQERMEEYFGEIISQLSKLALGILKKDSQKSLEGDLGEVKLGDARFADPSRHSPPHATMPATPGNEVAGRDPNLSYSLIEDMMTRKDSEKVVPSTEKVLAESSKKIEAQKQGAVSSERSPSSSPQSGDQSQLRGSSNTGSPFH